MARAISSVRNSVDAATLGSIIERAKRDGAVTTASLRLGKLTRVAEAELVEGLARAGLEHTGKAVRVPVRAQLVGLLDAAGEPGIQASAVPRSVKGARNATEVNLALRDLADEDVAAPVVHGKTIRWTRVGDGLCSASELDELARLAKELASLAKVTKAPKGKPRPTVRREELRAISAALHALAAKGGSRRPRAELIAALMSAPSPSGLVRVPDVVRALARIHPAPVLLAELDALAREGWIELRPEAGIGRMTEADEAACTKAIDGTPLSFARVIVPASGGPT